MTETHLTLYPPIEPFDTGFLQVDDIHTLYYEQSGNPDGVPVVFLHGGPGGGSSPKSRQFFDPAHYRIVVFDQRGCGQSRPLAETRNNTTELLVADIESLREKLGIAKWHVFGGSWGSTLSLTYAIAHPGRVLSLTLRGIFMMTERELDWFLYGVRAVYPDAWEKFVAEVPADRRGDLLEYYSTLFAHPDPSVRLKAAETWSTFEVSCCALFPRQLLPEENDPNHALSIAVIEAHYFRNNRFEPDDFILRNVPRIRHIPAVIVHGRYDAVCPVETAWQLHRAWPEAELTIVPDAGHASSEPGITHALIAATNKFRDIPAS
jgi:proline iminopeptidase